MPQLYIGRPLAGNPPLGAPHYALKILDSHSIAWSCALGAALALCIALMLLAAHPDSLPLGSLSWAELILAFLLLSIGHEALHMLVFPRCGLDRQTVIGVWPQLGAPFVQYLSPMRRNRFLYSAALPFLALTVLPVTLVANGVGPVGLLGWIAVVNCFGSGSDLFVLARTVRVVPRDAWVVENGETLLWGRT